MRRTTRHTAPDARLPRAFRYLNAALVVVATVGICAWAGGLQGLQTAFSGERQLADYRPRLTTEIYSTEIHPDSAPTHTLLGQVYKENRKLVPLSKMPLYLRQASVAVEDRRFYLHRGISPRDMIRAAWINLRGGTVKQGASTITQQLVRNIWLTQERTWNRKFKEILLAIEVERRFSKDEIIEMYLNEVYYGHGAYGIGTAARTFFGKVPGELTLGEATLLAGLPQAPARYSPFNHPHRAKSRRWEVLAAMRREGYISAAQAKETHEEQIQSRLAEKPIATGIIAKHAPHFIHLIIRNLCDTYGTDTVYEGGLRVYTTLDIRLQRIAEKALTAQVEKLRRDKRIKGGLVGQGALACVDVHTGDVLAMVGGVGPYEEVQYNRAHPGPRLYGRQPGSSFKPYVWTAGLESGYGSESVFSAEPLSIYTGGKWWRPKNYSTGQSGNYTLRNALAQSVNLVSVRLLQKVGADTVVGYAARMLDIPAKRLAAVPALALGVSNLSPLEQASGYACFASGGLRAKRRFIHRIETYRGEVLLDSHPQKTRVIRPETAVSMVRMLRAVIDYGTGTRARFAGCPMGGKTGTTQEGRDAWWVGITPDLSVAVWIGNDDNSPMHRSSGGYFCAPVWKEFMRQAIKIRPCTGKFPEGSGVRTTRRDEVTVEEQEEPESGAWVKICTQTGQRATDYCPSTTEKFFPTGADLPGLCTEHGPSTSPGTAPPPGGSAGEMTPAQERTIRVTICLDSGKLATLYCPRTKEMEFPVGAALTGTCQLHGPLVPPPSPPSSNKSEGDGKEATPVEGADE